MPPPTELTSDALLDIIACLPLGAIARLVQVQSAWKILVYTNESTVYHNAAMLHRFVPSVNTTLDDAVSTLDFDTSSLSIAGWKQFCRLRLGIERNWTGCGPSQMRNIGAIGENIHQRKTIPHSEYTITAALRYISVHDDADGIVWKLPENYFQSFPYFAYDAGYLALPNHLLNTIEIWREPSTEMLPYAPSPVQKIAAEATAAVYGAPAGGHFVPCYTLPSRGEAVLKEKLIKMMYPTLLSATPGDIHIWDISTALHVRTLHTTGTIHGHSMGDFRGIEISKEYVLAFDSVQIRLFSRHDGNFLFHFSNSSAGPVAIQLMPPRHTPSPGQCHGAALLPQVLFPRRKNWTQSRGEFQEVVLSSCGTTLIAMGWNKPLLIIHDLHRRVTGELPVQETTVNIKIAREYDDIRLTSPAVTADRIAVGTHAGILVLTLDRSGSRAAGSVCLRMPTGLSSPVCLSASFLHLSSTCNLRNITLLGTKLGFEGDVNMVPRKTLARYPKKRVVDPRRYRRTAVVPSVVTSVNVVVSSENDNTEEPPDIDGDQGDDADSIDSMPDLQSVSNSSDSEDADEESVCSSDEDQEARASETIFSEFSEATAAAEASIFPPDAENSDSHLLSDWSGSDSEDDNLLPPHHYPLPPPGMLPNPFGVLPLANNGNLVFQLTGEAQGNHTDEIAAFVVNVAPRT
ncbi:hypothetical protein K438DRAFT_1726031 [Mycena galopus ATCC 62051]|nr:hypothetical protein K438DRAFT_1726031 [Mycena galopus ATCC 62051]